MPLSLDSMTFEIVALAVGTSYFLTAVGKVVARRTGFLDRPDGRRKAQAAPMPLLGGVAVYVALVITVLVAKAWNPQWLGDGAADGTGRVTSMLLLSGGLFCAVGLWDDRVGLRPRTKFGLQVLASLPFVIWGRYVESFHVFDTQVEIGLLGSAFTVFWLVACSNVINLVDGLDGLAGTIGLIVCAAIAVLSDMQGAAATWALGLIFAGALFGFLLHNWPPASIYLGDSGSLTIGFVIGALAIESSTKRATGLALAIPLVLVSVPAFDTFMAIVRRKLNGKGIGEADRRHIHHRLLDRGLSRAQSLIVISALCAVMAGVTLVSAFFQNDRLAVGLCMALLALLIVGRVFGYDETVLFFRYIQAMSALLAGTSGVLKTQLVVDRMARDRGVEPIQYWKEITDHVAAAGGSELEFLCWNETRDDDVLCHLHWTSAQASGDSEPEWQFRYSVPGEQGLRATLTSHGRLDDRLKGHRLVDLVRLFDIFCRSWTSMAAHVGEVSVNSPKLAFPNRVPRSSDPLPMPNVRPQPMPLAAAGRAAIERRRAA